MRKISIISLLIILLVVVFSPLQAQNAGGISSEMLNKLKDSYQYNAQDRAVSNAIANNDIRKLAVNHDNATAFDAHFSHQVNSKAITGPSPSRSARMSCPSSSTPRCF